jgi:hypothetical protein
MQTMQDQRLEHRARRRAAAKLGWYAHATIYLVVNLALATLAFAQGRDWAVYPALGWGLGLAIHGVVVFIVTGGGGLLNRLVAHERRRLQAAKDPW